MNIDKSLKRMFGNKKSTSMFKNDIIKNFGLKSFGGKKDWDFDGITNKKDCQPRNTMRQDEEDPKDILRKITRKGSDITVKQGISPIILMNTVIANDPVIKQLQRVQSIHRDDNWFAQWNNEARRALREQGYSDDDIDDYLSRKSRAMENLASDVMRRMGLR